MNELEITLTADDMNDLMHGRSITTIATDGTEVAIFAPDDWKVIG